MAQNERGTTWFDGLTWVDVPVDLNLMPRNTNEDTGTSSCIIDATKKPVDAVYEFKLGLLMIFPTEIIFDILSRLPIEDLMRYQTVCKSWYRLTKDPHFINLQVCKAIRRPQSYLLQQIPFNPGDNLFFIDSGADKWTTKEMPLKSFYGNGRRIDVSDSCNGLLCVSVIGYEDPIIYNPITRDHMILPKSDFKPHKMCPAIALGFGFGFDWTRMKYKVVRVYNMYHDIQARKFHTKGEIITLGESSWRPLDFPHKIAHAGAGSDIESVFLNGAFHWGIHREKGCSELDHILVLDIIDETFRTIKFPPHVKLPEEELDLINFGETLAFVNNNRFNKDLLQVWQIVGNRADGGRLCQYSYDISVIDEQLNRGIALLGMLSNGDFLYKVLQTGEVDHTFSCFRNHLLRFSPQNNQGFLLEVPGIPKSFNSIPFTPSLASPGIFP